MECSGVTAPGNALAVGSSSAAAKASARTTDAELDLVLAAFGAAAHVPLTREERDAALRRALLVHAAGGDLHRDPTLDDPAILGLARDLDSPARRTALLGALPEALRGDEERAWRAYACALLAEELAES